MSAYLFPIRVALIFFPFVAALIVLPVYVYQYRKFGFVNKMRFFAIYAFVLYMMCAYFLVILPLPDTRDIISLLGTNCQTYDLQLFSSIQDIIRETQVVPTRPSTYLHLLRERAFLQVVFNVLLTVPFGVFMRYLFKRNIWQTALFSFFLTLFFELTQLSGLYGIYNAPYRLFSVDDIVQNTLGGLIGFWITPALTWFVPSLDDIDRKKQKKIGTVGLIRRTVAFIIDWLIVSGIVSMIHRYIHIENITWILYVVAIALYFVVLPYITRGYTVGKWLLRLKLTSDNGRPTFIALTKRAAVFYGVIMGINSAVSFIVLFFPDNPLVAVGGFMVSLVVDVLVVINFFVNIRSKEFFHDVLSGVSNEAVVPKNRS